METWRKNLRILWFTHLAGVMSFSFGIPFMPLYIQELETLSRSEITLYSTILAAAPAVTMGIMAPIWGYLSDRLGRKLMILRASFFAIFILGGMGLASSIFQLFILRVTQGFLTGTISAVTTFVASDAPEENMSSALGVITSATFLGFSAGPMLGGVLASKFGYRASFLLGGFLMAIVFLSVLFFVKENKEKFIKNRAKQKISIIKTYRKVLIPTVILILIMVFMLRVARTVFTPYLALYVEDHISNVETVPLITGMINGLTGAATAFSSIFIGKISIKFEKFGLLRLLIGSAIFVSVPLTLKIFTGSVFGFFTSFIFFVLIYVSLYFFLGGVEPLLTSVAALSVSPQNRGALFGLLAMVGSIAWFFGPVVAGPLAYYYDINAVIPIVPISLSIMFFLSILISKKVYGEEE